MKKSIVTITGFIASAIVNITPIYAQNQGVTVDENIGLEPIKITYFPQAQIITSQYSTVLSWISLGINLFALFIVLYWAFRIIMASVQSIKSLDKEEEIREAWGKVQRVMMAAIRSFLFPIILSVIGVLLDVGYLWEWPLAFRSCPGSSEYEYYYQALEALGKAENTTKADIDRLCFGG